MGTNVNPATAGNDFWLQFGEHLAVLTIQAGEVVGLAFLQGFLNKRFGSAAPTIGGLPPVA